MTKQIVIFNPAARGEKAQRLRKFLDAHAGPGIALRPTTGPGHARELAAAAVAEGATTFVAAGGDGTINEVVNGLVPHPVPLGILPLGTANVFARELGIPLRLTRAWEVVQRQRVATVDLGCVEAQGVRRYFVQLAGVGFDATAIRETSWELKKKFGPLSYLWGGLRTLWLWPHAPAVFIGNGRFYGGPFKLFPQAQLADGRLDICRLPRASLWGALLVVLGCHTARRDVEYFQTESYEHDGAQPFEVDGELAGTTPVRFTVAPRALRVIVP